MEIYKQEKEYDCMLACIATAVQKPIEEIWDEDFRDLIEHLKGTHGGNIDKAFAAAELRKDTDYWAISIPTDFPRYYILKNLLKGRRAILQVRSLNHMDGYHMVYWAGETLYDPSNKQVYQWLNQCSPAYVWLFDEINYRPQTICPCDDLDQNSRCP